MKVDRDISDLLIRYASRFPAVTLTGPRQSGKSTLCKTIFPALPVANLEEPDTRAYAADDPRGFLAGYPDGAVFDEVQRCPSLLSYLQGIIDADPRPGRWVLTGSHNLSLLESVGQSLAGRTAVAHLLPLARTEVRRFPKHPRALEETLVAGGYPAIFDRRLEPAEWLASYVATYLERDVRSISRVIDLASFQRFLTLCAGRTGQLLNLSALASETGVSQPTAKAWLSILEASFVVFRLPAFHASLVKRLVKMPKLHFYDTGLACWLLGIRTPDHLRAHPLRGPLFETWVVSEVVKQRVNRGETGGVFFYRDRHGTEADLVIQNGNRLSVVEVKASATITADLLASPVRVASILEKAGPVTSAVVHGGAARQVRGGVAALPWNAVDELLAV
jgi:predicted AAA+ superfamily ATPase